MVKGAGRPKAEAFALECLEGKVMLITPCINTMYKLVKNIHGRFYINSIYADVSND